MSSNKHNSLIMLRVTVVDDLDSDDEDAKPKKEKRMTTNKKKAENFL